MRANEFIIAHGLQYTRNLVRDYPFHTHVTDDGRMFINENTCPTHIKFQLNDLVKMDDLKRYVDAYDVVQSYGGLKESIRFSKQTYRLTSTPQTHKKLCEAITLVEECQ